jgi:hypothetical protein
MSGFTDFLKKAGSVLATVGAKEIPVIGGIVSLLIPQAKRGQVAKIEATIQNDLSVFAGILVQVEAVGSGVKNQDGTPMTGAQKFAAARPLVRTALLGTALVSNHKLDDSDAARALFEKAVDEYTQATVDLLKSFHLDGVQTQSATA